MTFQKTALIIFKLVPNYQGNFTLSGSDVRTVEILKRINKHVTVHLFGSKDSHTIFDSFKIKHLWHPLPLKNAFVYRSKIDLALKAMYVILKTLYNRDFIQELASLANSNKTIIYSTSDLFWEVVPAYICKIWHPKYVWIQCIHHLYPNWKKRPGNKLVNMLGYYAQAASLHLIKQKANKIITVNKNTRSTLSSLGYNQMSIYQVGNGIDLKYISKIPEPKKLYQASFFGRFDPSKGSEDLLKIWSQVIKLNPKYRLIVIGKVFENNQVMKKVKDLKLQKNIIFTGYIPYPQAIKKLKSSKIFISTSHEEGFGITIAEAIACKLPVIAWGLPIYHEVFKNHLTYVPHFNIATFTTYLSNAISKPLNRKAIQTNLNYIKQYSWDTIADKELKIIQN